MNINEMPDGNTAALNAYEVEQDQLEQSPELEFELVDEEVIARSKGLIYEHLIDIQSPLTIQALRKLDDEFQALMECDHSDDLDKEPWRDVVLMARRANDLRKALHESLAEELEPIAKEQLRRENDPDFIPF